MIKQIVFDGKTTPKEAEEMIQLLTPREKELLRNLSSGLKRVEVAAKMGISPKTYDQHLVHIKGKVGIKTVALLMRLWIIARGA